jgi:TolA-binding protein
MQNKVKLTKRQIKEDKFTAFMLTSKDEFLEHWQKYVLGAAVVVLAVVAVFYYSSARKASHIEAGQKLAQAMMDYRAGNNQVAILGLNQIIENYGGDDAAEQATFLLGKVNYDSKNYPEAIRYFEMYLSKYHDSKLDRAAALAGIGASQMNQGNYSDAAARYQAAIDEYPDGPLVENYNLEALRADLLQGDMDKAKARLATITDKYKGSETAFQAQLLYSEKART